MKKRTLRFGRFVVAITLFFVMSGCAGFLNGIGDSMMAGW